MTITPEALAELEALLAKALAPVMLGGPRDRNLEREQERAAARGAVLGAVPALLAENTALKAQVAGMREALERIGWHELTWREARDVARTALQSENGNG